MSRVTTRACACSLADSSGKYKSFPDAKGQKTGKLLVSTWQVTKAPAPVPTAMEGRGDDRDLLQVRQSTALVDVLQGITRVYDLRPRTLGSLGDVGAAGGWRRGGQGPGMARGDGCTSK
jgi:hypothetical protein